MTDSLKPEIGGNRHYAAPCGQCGRPYSGAHLTCDRCAEQAHTQERTTGAYTGPTGRFWRIVDPAHPADYYGWSSTQEAAERFTRSPDVPSAAVVMAAPQLTAYEARHCDLARPLERPSFTEWRATQDYLLTHRIPTIHES